MSKTLKECTYEYKRSKEITTYQINGRYINLDKVTIDTIIYTYFKNILGIELSKAERNLLWKVTYMVRG